MRCEQRQHVHRRSDKQPLCGRYSLERERRWALGVDLPGQQRWYECELLGEQTDHWWGWDGRGIPSLWQLRRKQRWHLQFRPDGQSLYCGYRLWGERFRPLVMDLPGQQRWRHPKLFSEQTNHGGGWDGWWGQRRL
ncbi:MAG: hypothetical protein A3F73_07790 [Gallionellales bacterium RIFCSPLOWO2_12_FULL_59_22]|nr:MAG: hypothetical protein A3F73_07790 [Gallionellales bacterium RIFCSPLOWO2_12_FULL_59_22]